MKDEKKTKEIYIFTSDVDVEECCTFFNSELKTSFQQFLIFLSFVNIHIVYNIIYIYIYIYIYINIYGHSLYTEAALHRCSYKEVF